MKVSFGWEDDESAHIHYLECDCGTIIGGRTVTSGEVVQCPGCGKRYEFVWRGMEVNEMVTTCDACGLETGLSGLGFGVYLPSFGERVIDLCPDCAQNLRAYLSSLGVDGLDTLLERKEGGSR